MKLKKQDIIEGIKRARKEYTYEQWVKTVLFWGDFFKNKDPNFNRAKFYAACGFGE